jgi:preprotein translocase subunit SecY
MASAAENLAATLNWSAFNKAGELKSRIWFTLGALIVYRLGTHVPLPGIDPEALAKMFAQHSGGILGMFDMLSGGALFRMTIFALNVMPYITASIIMQLLSPIIPSLDALKKEGEQGRMKINQYSRYLTVMFAVVQSYALAVGLENSNAEAVQNPGLFFRISTVITLTGGTLFLMWLGEQITARGIGNGVSLIIYTGIVATLPISLSNTLELARTGAISGWFIALLVVLLTGVLALCVACERAQRRVLVQYPKRQMGNKMFGGEAQHMPLKLNTSGVIPPIFASSLLLFPLTLASFTDMGQTGWLATIIAQLGHGKPLFMLLYAALIIFFAFLYTSLVFNPDETADNLKKSGGFIPGIRPGTATADHLDFILTRLTVLGAAYLTVVCLLPEFLTSQFSAPFYMGGTSLLIVVSVTIDTIGKVQSHLMAQQYEGLIRKAKLRGRKV